MQGLQGPCEGSLYGTCTDLAVTTNGLTARLQVQKIKNVSSNLEEKDANKFTLLNAKKKSTGHKGLSHRNPSGSHRTLAGPS